MGAQWEFNWKHSENNDERGPRLGQLSFAFPGVIDKKPLAGGR